jgi:hypothetical protein
MRKTDLSAKQVKFKYVKSRTDRPFKGRKMIAVNADVGM